MKTFFFSAAEKIVILRLGMSSKSQDVKILFNPILFYLFIFFFLSFFGKILFSPIFWEMSYFILFFGQFAFNLVFYSLLSSLFHVRTFLKIFCLASLSIKIHFVHIMLQSHFFYLFHCLMPC